MDTKTVRFSTHLMARQEGALEKRIYLLRFPCFAIFDFIVYVNIEMNKYKKQRKKEKEKKEETNT